MNILSIAYCRIYQGLFRLMQPMLPYREPKILADEKDLILVLREKNITRVMLVTDKGVYGSGLTADLEHELDRAGIKVTTFSGVVPNPNTLNVEDCVKIYNANCCEAIIAFGGGSPIDCAKALGARIANPKKSLRQMKGLLKVSRKLPLLIAIPTTAGTGSETSVSAVITDSDTRHKYVINDFNLIPNYAMLKAKLTIGLPPYITATTAMDALTHAIEAYIGRSTTKETRKKAKDAVNLILNNVLIAYKDGSNIEARENLLKASFYAGVAFSKSYVGYVHAISHSLGGKYNVPHALANAVILPYVLRAYGKKIYRKLFKLGLHAGLYDDNTTIEEGVYKFMKAIDKLNEVMNIPNKIDEIEIEDIRSLAKIAAKEANPLYPVPVLFSARELEMIYYDIKK
ncbi:MAG: iron-containing alcohol dehydrogenase [Clostridia bacterium]|nr:iron-containing alcohol dehydrogenase [Clostridia bacterium]